MEYKKISPTAETIAFIRGETDIPYARLIARLCNAQEATRQFYRRPDFEIDLSRMKKLAIWAKLRLYAFIEAVKQSEISNILELASGFSPAGLICSQDPTIRYLEIDLPKIVERKKALVQALTRRDNLVFAPLNVLDFEDLRLVAFFSFTHGPLAVINEGLLQYFTHDEKFELASNINQILKPRGGVWVTTDIVLKSHLVEAFNASLYTRTMRDILAENTGRDMVELAFDSFEQAEELFGKAGFLVEKHAQLELAGDFISPGDLQNRTHLVHQQIWIMRAK